MRLLFACDLLLTLLNAFTVDDTVFVAGLLAKLRLVFFPSLQTAGGICSLGQQHFTANKPFGSAAL